MSVAENPTTEQTLHNPQHRLALASAIGALALLVGLGFIFAGLPMLWSNSWDRLFAESPDLKNNVFLSDALLILVELLVIGGFVYGAFVVLQQQTQVGMRAGAVFLAIYVFACLWFTAWLGDVMVNQFREEPTLGWTVLLVILAALLGAAGYLYAMVPGWMNFLEIVDLQGWFHGYSYKGNQGVRVRRGTIVGILAVGICGIITMVTHGIFGRERLDMNNMLVPNDWYWLVPYTRGESYIPLMFKVHMLMPIVIALLLFWIAWRVVNITGFADFLIATEAEMNKVSWTNRRRLVADTIVVLTTVFLFTAFLFIVDVIWIKVLSAPGIQVLLIDPKQEQQKQQEKAQW